MPGCSRRARTRASRIRRVARSPSVAGTSSTFKRDAAIELFVFRGVDDAHAAAGDAFEQAVARASEIGFVGTGAKTLDGFVRQRFHLASQPKTARASRWNSSSLPQISRRRSRAPRRNSRRAQASAFVTSVTGMPYSAASLS